MVLKYIKWQLRLTLYEEMEVSTSNGLGESAGGGDVFKEFTAGDKLKDDGDNFI